MADFANALHWDPSVSEAVRDGSGEVGLGSAFDLVARFAGRAVALRYTIVSYEPPRDVVLAAERPAFVSRDTITVAPAAAGSVVSYDARLEFRGIARVFDPIAQRVFDRTGRKAAAGIRAALNA